MKKPSKKPRRKIGIAEARVLLAKAKGKKVTKKKVVKKKPQKGMTYNEFRKKYFPNNEDGIHPFSEDAFCFGGFFEG